MNLIKLALAAEQWTAGHGSMAVVAEDCLNAKDKDSACDLCVQTCPTAAITFAPDVTLNAETCIHCGLCTHRCPTGVFHADDGAHRLLHCVSQIVDHENIEIACKHHPNPAVGNQRVDAVIKTNGCLSRLGASAYLGLFAMGVRKAYVRLDACADCPLGALRPEIEATMDEARQWGGQQMTPLMIEDAPPAKRAKSRTLYSVMNPPVSRRGMLRMMTLQGTGQAEKVIAHYTAQAGNDSRLPDERRRRMAALQFMSPTDDPLPAHAFTELTVSDTCTACGLCARICPTGALEYDENEEAFALTFSPAQCIHCDLCTHLCETQALQAGGTPTREAVLSESVVTLYVQSIKTCQKCRVTFKGSGDLCPTCEFRRQNPFGYVANPRAYLASRQ